MHHTKIMSLLDSYLTGPNCTAVEIPMVKLMQTLAVESNNCFDTDFYLPGHFTGSAFIVHPSEDRVLLTLHAKLKKWVQLGGHADGNPDIFEVALREGLEESGISQLGPLSTEIFDVDIHNIPDGPRRPAHKHFDIRFLFRASSAEFNISSESIDLDWIALENVGALCQSPSMDRMVQKLVRKLQKTTTVISTA